MTNNKMWSAAYACRHVETAVALAKGQILKEYGIEPETTAFRAERISDERGVVVKVSIPVAIIDYMQVLKASKVLAETEAQRVLDERLRHQARMQRRARRKEDARVIVSDNKVTHYGRNRRQYLAEVELEGARITASVIGVDLTPAQHAAFKAALTTALHEGIIAESEKK